MIAREALQIAFCREHQGQRGVGDVPAAGPIIEALAASCPYDLRQWARIMSLAAERLEEKPSLYPIPVHPEEEQPMADLFREPDA